ncbi:MAG: hypothetical protein AAGF47_07630 [Planctomycetota bacterium]
MTTARTRRLTREQNLTIGRLGRTHAGTTLRAVCLGIVLAVTAGAATSVEAQLATAVEPAEAYKIVTTDARSLVRCGPGAAYYPVAESLTVGSVLTVDGRTSGGWLRVRYPERAAALVDSESVNYASDRGVATLTRPSSLSALNAATGARGSWSKLLDEPLPAGTELRVIAEAINEQTGERVGYQVEPPPSARAYVRESFTRRATSADLEMRPDAEAPADAPAADATAAVPVAPAAGDAAPAHEADATPGGGATPSRQQAMEDSLEPAVAEPGDVLALQPAEASEPTIENADSNPETAPVAEIGGTGDQTEARIETIEDLESAFSAVQSQPLAEAEFDQLLAEVDRMLDAEPAGSGLRPAIESRRDVLMIRKRVQDAWRENVEVARRAADAAGDINNQIRRLQVDRSYSAIGRLLPSAVYDGTRLPRMYRIQSIDTTEAPRTLGYLRPDPKLGLETMLNQTVGVVGSPRLDPRLNLLVIEPIEIDLIGVTGE